MFLQDTPPDTSAYMVAGYTIFFVIAAVYLFSLSIRNRNLSRDLDLLESMKQDDKAPEIKSAPARPRGKKAQSSRSKSTKKKTVRK